MTEEFENKDDKGSKETNFHSRRNGPSRWSLEDESLIREEGWTDRTADTRK